MDTTEPIKNTAHEKEMEHFKSLLQKEMIMREKNCIAEVMSVMSKYNCVFTSKVEVAAQPLI